MSPRQMPSSSNMVTLNEFPNHLIDNPLPRAYAPHGVGYNTNYTDDYDYNSPKKSERTGDGLKRSSSNETANNQTTGGDRPQLFFKR